MQLFSATFSWKHRRRTAALLLDVLLVVSGIMLLLQPAMLWYKVEQDATSTSAKFLIALLCIVIRPTLHRKGVAEQRPPSNHKRNRSSNGICIPRPLASSALLFLCIMTCISTAQAQFIIPVRPDDGGVISIPSIIGAIWTVLGAIWNIFSTIWSAFVMFLAASKYLGCWLTALMILVYIVVQALEFYNLTISTSIFREIDKFFLNALDCEPIQPEYGPYRKEKFRDGDDPKPQPTSFFDLRKRSVHYMTRTDDYGDIVYPAVSKAEL